MISDIWMQELLSKSDIVSVIGEYTTLTPKGGKLWACCPFHNEKTPSFNVDPTSQLYYCFGCHKGGNVLTFIKEKENLSGFEALRYLADRAGMEMPASDIDREKAERMRSLRARICDANREAAKYYHSMLIQGGKGLEYLRSRGLSDGIITRFGLGFAPDRWSALFEHLTSLGYTEDEIISAGLAKKNDAGNVFDFFRNRVIFPIIDEKGNVLAFGGRTMGDDKPKYLNTGDTPVYNKKNNVYALNILKRTTHSDIIITEGYMDVISLHSVGVNNAVATLGTALTENQARLLKRRTNLIYVSYDGDSAGQNATMRGLDILAHEGLEVRVITLPDGLDPDDFAKKYGKEGYMRLKDESLALNAFKLEHIAAKYNLDNADDRQKYAIEACRLVAALQPVEQERYYNVIAKKTGLSFETVKAQGQRYAGKPEIPNTTAQIRNNREKPSVFAKTDTDRTELLLCACAAASEKACEIIFNEALSLIRRNDIRSFLQAAQGVYKSSGKCDVSLILTESDMDLSAVTAALFEMNTDEPVKTARDCIRHIKKEKLEEDLRSLGIAVDTNQISPEEYRTKYSELISELRRLT